MERNQPRTGDAQPAPDARSLMLHDPFFADLDRFHSGFFDRPDALFGGMLARFFGGPSQPPADGLARTGPREEGLFRASPFRGFEEALRGFEDLDPAELGAAAPRGNFISQTFVSAQKIGPDGRVHREDYFKNNINGLSESGKRIGQSEEMYKNTGTGVKKMAQQRVLDDRGYKVVKSKVGEGRLPVTQRLKKSSSSTEATRTSSARSSRGSGPTKPGRSASRI